MKKKLRTEVILFRASPLPPRPEPLDRSGLHLVSLACGVVIRRGGGFAPRHFGILFIQSLGR